MTCGVCIDGVQSAGFHWGQGLAVVRTSALHRVQAWKKAPVDDWSPCLSQHMVLPGAVLLDLKCDGDASGGKKYRKSKVYRKCLKSDFEKCMKSVCQIVECVKSA